MFILAEIKRFFTEEETLKFKPQKKGGNCIVKQKNQPTITIELSKIFSWVFNSS
jgi:hypothetical protein